MMIEYKSGKETRIQLLDFVRAYQEQNGGLSPSMRDIAAGLNVSVPNVAHHVKRLVQAGLLVKDQGKSRSIRIAASCIDEKLMIDTDQ